MKGIQSILLLINGRFAYQVSKLSFVPRLVLKNRIFTARRLLAIFAPRRTLGERSRYDDLQALFLMRLVRIMKLRAGLRSRLSGKDARSKLIDAAFRSTMRDCEALGVEAEAQALLEAD